MATAKEDENDVILLEDENPEESCIIIENNTTIIEILDEGEVTLEETIQIPSDYQIDDLPSDYQIVDQTFGSQSNDPEDTPQEVKSKNIN